MFTNQTEFFAMSPFVHLHFSVVSHDTEIPVIEEKHVISASFT